MSPSSHTLPRAALALAAVALSAQAFADCTTPPFLLPLHIRVGADATHCQADSIQAAIDAVGECPTVIDITREHLYTHQNLYVADKSSLTLQGWGDGVTCAQIPGNLDFPPYSPPTSTNPLVTVTANNAGGRVVTIVGTSHVAIRNLTITGGATADTAVGGGISFDGAGSLELTRSTVNLNAAGSGGGIAINGNADGATLTLSDDTLVLSNTASDSGGGIQVKGYARLYALKPNTLIAYNQAPNGYGGGVQVLGPGRADVGSPGYGGLPVIYTNGARYGGGIAAVNVDSDNTHYSIVRAFTTDPARPVQISNNAASATGGGIYLRPNNGIGDFSAAVFCAYDFRIEDNLAQEGAAIYSDLDSRLGSQVGGWVALNTAPDFAGAVENMCVAAEPPTALGAVACAPGVPCNRIDANVAADGSGNPTAGSTILLQNDSELHADRVSARHNTGAHVARLLGDGGVGVAAEFSNCLLADNAVTQELVAITGGNAGVATFASCTLARNDIGAPYVLRLPNVAITNSIVDQPGRATVDPPTNAADHVLTNDTTTLPVKPGILFGAPTFVDAASGDYRLVSTSLGVDQAPASTLHADLARRSRNVDLPGVANASGPLDLGAYEIQLACSGSDTIFCDGFDSGGAP